jgi:alkanesulfonate monooxygenase SsuD/methylene tetrahydromethanopterin reductase-like flavin-dependent oxidoreductase (luciferase family)
MGSGSMDIGLVLQTDPPARRVIELARRADGDGFSHVWTFDSHVLWQEPFVIYSQILAQTASVTVGPMVTNPLSRDPSVTASLFATLGDAGPGPQPRIAGHPVRRDAHHQGPRQREDRRLPR